MMAAAVSAIVFAVWHFLPRDPVSHVSQSQAVRLFDRHMRGHADAEPAGGPWPQLGVYRYDTQGWEAVDVGPLDGTHDYDGESTVTLWPGRCGVVERWQVLVTRWSEAEACRDQRGGRMTTLHEFREFYGVAQEDRFTCDGRFSLSASNGRPGQILRAACTSAAASVLHEMEVVGVTRMNVAGETVEAVHLNGMSAAHGKSSGSVMVEEWRRRADGLLLRRRVRGSFSTDSHGGTEYKESYLISLNSMRPER
jgi:hypothetical protein